MAAIGLVREDATVAA